MSDRDPVTAHEVGKDYGDGYSFAIDDAKVAAALRKIADRIEKGHVVAIQKFTVLSIAKTEEYTLTFLRMSFHERNVGGDKS